MKEDTPSPTPSTCVDPAEICCECDMVLDTVVQPSALGDAVSLSASLANPHSQSQVVSEVRPQGLVGASEAHPNHTEPES